MSAPDYPIFLVYSEEDQAWLARVDLLPGCIADGDTPEEALRNAKDAVKIWIETAKELNRPIPPPLSLQQIEAFQLKVMQKQQEAVQAAIQAGIQQAVDDVVRSFQQTPKQGAFVVDCTSGYRFAMGEASPLSSLGVAGSR